MERFEQGGQTIYYLESSRKVLFYNNKNGKLAICGNVPRIKREDIIIRLNDSGFFEPDANLSMLKTAENNYEQLYLAVSESCNFRCKYCRQDKENDIINMSKEEIKNAVNVFYHVSGDPKSIVFFGGEPLMNAEGVVYAVEYIRNFDKDIQFSMVTNGALCTEELANFFADNNVEVIVSMDGPESIHDEARKSVGGNGTYQMALRGYQNLKEAGCKVGISVVVGPHNEGHFDELVKWAISMQPNSFGLCLPHGDEKNYAMQLRSFDNIHKEMVEAFDVLHRNKIYLVQVEQKMIAFLQGKLIPYECKSCGKRIVACKGKKFGHCEGAITKPEMFFYKIESLAPLVLEYKKTSPLFIPECESCISFRICGGSCPYDKLTRFQRTDVPDRCRCGLNRLIAERAMEHALEYTIQPSEGECHILSQQDRAVLMEVLTTL